MDHFISLGQYAQFAMAREFITTENSRTYGYAKNRREKWGDFIVAPLMRPANYVTLNIRSPLMITALVVAGLALATLIFYPGLVPGLFFLAKSCKFAAFLMTQSTILGFCLRTLGRLGNGELMNAWDRNLLTPVKIGTLINA